ncbi:MAG: EamA family transporter [Rikenellaceae bacterium]|jgi:drug/metabolite transporter (DMT)-like permease|nr:EamA family transporter [Rikenellaceae bacterium]
MLYLLAATVGSSLLVIILKIVKMQGGNATAAITVNYLVGTVLTLLFSPAATTAPAYVAHAPWFWMSVIVGISFMVSLVVYAVSADRSGVAITTISGRAAMAIPVIFAFVALGEQPTPLKIGLLAAIFVAMWLILKGSGGGRNTRAGWIAAVGLPLLVFLLNGLNDTMMQYTKRALIPDAQDNMIFTATMFAASAVTGFVFYFFENRGRLPVPDMLSVLWGVALGVANTVCCIGILYALERMDGSVFYPLYYAGAVVISTVVGVWAFREKLSVVNYVGIVIALVAIVLLAAL